MRSFKDVAVGVSEELYELGGRKLMRYSYGFLVKNCRPKYTIT